MSKEKEPRIVELGAVGSGHAGGGMGPPIVPDTPENRLEEMIRQANLLGTENNQAGNGKKNPSKAVRAERRAKKLARKKNRYNR